MSEKDYFDQVVFQAGILLMKNFDLPYCEILTKWSEIPPRWLPYFLYEHTMLL